MVEDLRTLGYKNGKKMTKTGMSSNDYLGMMIILMLPYHYENIMLFKSCNFMNLIELNFHKYMLN